MKRSIVVFVLSVLSVPALAFDSGAPYVDPYVAIGFNPAQGTHLRAGVDLGVGLSEQMAVGVGGYYAAGEDPANDREFGGGPFLSYIQPITGFLIGSVRQDLLYVDLHDPYTITDASGTRDTHTAETGVASATSVGVHLRFTPNFGVSGGYRLVVGLTNESLDDGRSGAFLGFSIGI